MEQGRLRALRVFDLVPVEESSAYDTLLRVEAGVAVELAPGSSSPRA
jgi:hypothetical protein